MDNLVGLKDGETSWAIWSELRQHLDSLLGLAQVPWQSHLAHGQWLAESLRDSFAAFYEPLLLLKVKANKEIGAQLVKATAVLLMVRV